MTAHRSSYHASAPASVMLLGEHAVLNGHPALVCALSQRLHVTLTPIANKQITIFSDRFGEFSSTISALSITKPFDYILASLLRYKKQIPSGFKLVIHAEFSEDIGFGSSAAVTIATVAVLYQWLGLPIMPLSFFKECLEIIRIIQGFASGADVAASLLGGLIMLRPHPFAIEQLPYSPPIILVYSGYKTPTTAVIHKVNKLFQSRPEELKQIFSDIAKCTQLGYAASQKQDWIKLAKAFAKQHRLSADLAISDATLEKIIARLNHDPAILGAKISGAGLGDCVVALRTSSKAYPQIPREWTLENIRVIDTSISSQGLIMA